MSPNDLSTETGSWIFYSGKASTDSSVTCGSSVGVRMARLWQPGLFMAQSQLHTLALEREKWLFHLQEQSQETQYNHNPKKHCSSETHFSLHFCLLGLGTVIRCWLVLEELTSFLAQYVILSKRRVDGAEIPPMPFTKCRVRSFLAFLFFASGLMEVKGRKNTRSKEPGMAFPFVCMLSELQSMSNSFWISNSFIRR